MYVVKIDYRECEDNRFCIELCPEDVFDVVGEQVRVVKNDECTGCYLCVENCPTGAVTID